MSYRTVTRATPAKPGILWSDREWQTIVHAARQAQRHRRCGDAQAARYFETEVRRWARVAAVRAEWAS